MGRLLLGITTILALGFGTKASAGILLEPYAGAISHTSKLTYQVVGLDWPIPGTGTLTQFGARVGITMPAFFLAADYSMISGKVTLSNITIGGYTSNVDPLESDNSQTVLGITAGVNIPMFRFYAGYNFDHKSTFKSTSSTGTKSEILYSGGSSYKVGAGYTGLPFVAINVEYWATSFGKLKDQIAGTEADVGSSATNVKKAEFSGIGLTLSAPFSL